MDQSVPNDFSAQGVKHTKFPG